MRVARAMCRALAVRHAGTLEPGVLLLLLLFMLLLLPSWLSMIVC